MRSLIEWNDELAFGIPLVDEEHKALIGMVNRVYELIGADQLEEAKRFLTDSILKYTQTHFRDEERYMEEIGYPDLERHKKIHQNFARLVAEEAEKVKGGNRKDFEVLLGLLWSWLYRHIMVTDRKFAEYAKEMGKL